MSNLNGIAGWLFRIRPTVNQYAVSGDRWPCSPQRSAKATKLVLLFNEARAKSGVKIECRI